MNAGGSLAAHRQIKQGIADASGAGAAKGASEPWDNSEFSLPKAVATAGAGVQGEVEALGEKGTLGAMHLPLDYARARASAAGETFGRMMGVGERHGVDMLGGMRQMGVAGRSAQGAIEDYGRASIKNLAFGSGSPYSPIPYTQLPNQMTVRDLDTGARIMSRADPGYAGVPSVEFLDSLAMTAYQRRVQLNEDPNRTINDASRAANLDSWMRQSFNQLPDKGMAGGLKELLGL